MVPYANGKNTTKEQQIYNKEQSSARMPIENTFGIWTNRWQPISKKMVLYPQNAKYVALATIALHNFLINSDHYSSDEHINLNVNEASRLRNFSDEHTTEEKTEPKQIRDAIKDFIVTQNQK